MHEGHALEPPLNTVLLWLSTAVERDYSRRAVFPRLRLSKAHASRGALFLYYVTRGEAAMLLQDASTRYQAERGSLKNAYGMHVARTKEAMLEAANRPATLGAPLPVCVWQCSDREVWRGTKQQLMACGITLPGAWPREPGGSERVASTVDARGYRTRITRHSAMWSGIFEARIEIGRQGTAAIVPAAGCRDLVAAAAQDVALQRFLRAAVATVPSRGKQGGSP